MTQDTCVYLQRCVSLPVFPHYVTLLLWDLSGCQRFVAVLSRQQPPEGETLIRSDLTGIETTSNGGNSTLKNPCRLNT